MRLGHLTPGLYRDNEHKLLEFAEPVEKQKKKIKERDSIQTVKMGGCCSIIF